MGMGRERQGREGRWAQGGHGEGVKGVRVDVSFLSPNPPDGT